MIWECHLFWSQETRLWRYPLSFLQWTPPKWCQIWVLVKLDSENVRKKLNCRVINKIEKTFQGWFLGISGCKDVLNLTPIVLLLYPRKNVYIMERIIVLSHFFYDYINFIYYSSIIKESDFNELRVFNPLPRQISPSSCIRLLELNAVNAKYQN